MEKKSKQIFKIHNLGKLTFLTISYLFSIPKNCTNLKFQCPLEVLHMEKIGKNIFTGWKKKLFYWENIFSNFSYLFVWKNGKNNFFN